MTLIIQTTKDFEFNPLDSFHWNGVEKDQQTGEYIGTMVQMAGGQTVERDTEVRIKVIEG